MSEVQRALQRMEEEGWQAYLAELRRLDAPDPPDADEVTTDPYHRSDAGHPLGPGYPSGTPLRRDGQSHREAWMMILRDDACGYCRRRGRAGTLDHIIAKAGKNGLVHAWSNYAGACASCNNSKDGEKMLFFLLKRVGVR